MVNTAQSLKGFRKITKTHVGPGVYCTLTCMQRLGPRRTLDYGQKICDKKTDVNILSRATAVWSEENQRRFGPRAKVLSCTAHTHK